jgi:hypothetical protein
MANLKLDIKWMTKYVVNFFSFKNVSSHTTGTRPEGRKMLQRLTMNLDVVVRIRICIFKPTATN